MGAFTVKTSVALLVDILFTYAAHIAHIAEVDTWRMHTHAFGKAEIASLNIERAS